MNTSEYIQKLADLKFAATRKKSKTVKKTNKVKKTRKSSKTLNSTPATYYPGYSGQQFIPYPDQQILSYPYQDQYPYPDFNMPDMNQLMQTLNSSQMHQAPQIPTTDQMNNSSDKPDNSSMLGRVADKFLPELSAYPLGKLVTGMEEYGNFKYDQSTPIGELFADFANNRLQQKGLNGNIYYTQTQPRSFLNSSTPRSDLENMIRSLGVPKTDAYSIYDSNGITDPEDIKELLSRPFTQDMIASRNSTGFSDRINKAQAEGQEWFGNLVRDINNGRRNGKSQQEAMADAFSNLMEDTSPFQNVKGVVRAPRNNLRALAHEYGHIESEMGNEAILNSRLGPAYGFLRTALSSPIDEIYQNYAPSNVKRFFGNISDSLNQTDFGKVINSLTQQVVLGNMQTLPTRAVSLTKGLGVLAPETMKDLKEKDPTGILNYIDEHPVASTIIAALPSIGREAATTIPGTKMTYDFWKALKNRNNEFMRNHVFSDQVRNGLSNLADINPNWEAAKFFMKNLGKTTLGITAPLIGVLALDKIMKWKQERDGNLANQPNNQI